MKTKNQKIFKNVFKGIFLWLHILCKQNIAATERQKGEKLWLVKLLV